MKSNVVEEEGSGGVVATCIYLYYLLYMEMGHLPPSGKTLAYLHAQEINSTFLILPPLVSLINFVSKHFSLINLI